MDWFPLHIFPGGGFDSSIISVVFLGLLCVWWLTETFGFVFVGLVVPGYLASVFVISPTSALVVILESVATYALVWFASEFFGKTRVWSIFFGRDRFFAFLLISLFVRLVGELWLWPDFWRSWTEITGISPHLPGSLNSVGLVLVPLTANMLWKVGLIRGVLQVGVPTAMVYVVSTYLLLPLTNLRFSEFQVQYEDVAIDILNSPKSYIILLVTASMSARANIRFGWDFGGILIPALIAISWFDPNKGLVTLGEAVLLMWLAKFLMGSRVFKQSNLEGPRRVVFVFTTGFFLKFVLAWGIYLVAPHLRVIDFFGFGYLLSSLLAVKMLQKKSVGLVMGPTIVVSIAGFVLGGAIAAGLALDDDDYELDSQETVSMEAGRRPIIEASLVSRHALVGGQVALGPPVMPLELERFGSVIATIDSNARGGRMAPKALAGALRELGLEIDVVADGERQAMVIGESFEVYPRQRGWGLYVYWPKSKGPVIQVPVVSDDPNAMLACLAVARAVDARALMFGAVALTPTGRELKPQIESISPFHRAAMPTRTNDVIRIRFRRRSKLWLGGAIENLFPLGAIKRVAGESKVVFEHPTEPNLQRSQAEANFVTMDLSSAAVMRAADSIAPGEIGTVPVLTWEDLEGQILGTERRIAGSVPELGEALAPAQVEAAHRGVVVPLLEVAQQSLSQSEFAARIRSIRSIARWIGLDVQRVESASDCYFVVSEATQPVRGFGISLIRCDAGSPMVLEAPFPIMERSTWRFALLMARDFDARAVTIGSMVRTTTDELSGSPLIHGSLLASTQRAALTLRGTGPVWTLQIRGLSANRLVQDDIVASMESPLVVADSPPDLAAVIGMLNESGVQTSFDTGGLELASLRGIPDMTASFARKYAQGRFARLWLGQPFRNRLTPSPGVETMRKIARGAGLTVVQGDFIQFSPDADLVELPEIIEPLELGPWVFSAQRFAVTRNTLHLLRLAREMRDAGLTPVVWMDEVRGQSWMLAPYRRNGVRVVAIRLQRSKSGAAIVDRTTLTELGLINAVSIDVTALGKR